MSAFSKSVSRSLERPSSLQRPLALSGRWLGKSPKSKDAVRWGSLGTEKCRFVAGEMGFDTCVDHRAPDFVKQLEGACSKGIDVYFENVGGTVQLMVWPLLRPAPRR
jgi:hypothetical protein